MRCSTRGALSILAMSLSVAISSSIAACGSDDFVCEGAGILPHESPKALGIFRLLEGGETPNPGSPEAVPYEWTLFLQSTCGTPLIIEKVCIVGDGHNGDADDPAFSIDGPVPATVTKGRFAAVRVTYDVGSVNEDLDDDDERDSDSVAIVIQSNATNFPTLVVPICAITVPKNAVATTTYSCASPVIVPAGQADRTLCAE